MKLPRLAAFSVAWSLAALTLGVPGAGADHPRQSLRGYLRLMPGIETGSGLSDPSFNLMVHNRLNYRLEFPEVLEVRVEGRNRLMYRELFRDLPDAEALFGRDEGLFDLTHAWLAHGSWLGQSMIDRLYLDIDRNDWRFRIGRQRINWGINLVSNPNDIFNTYSFFDFDYPERPGSDALRIEYYPGHLSSVEVAVAGSAESANAVSAFRYLVNRGGWDIQVLAGRYRERFALGTGWAGNIGEAGFKGEATWFRDRRDAGHGERRENIVAAAGLDYMFPNGTFGTLEILYNGGHGRETGDPGLLTGPLRADDIMFSRFAVTVNADHAFSPVFGAGVSLMSLPDISAFYLAPKLNHSLAENLDFEVTGQFFSGGSGTPVEDTGSALFASLKWFF